MDDAFMAPFLVVAPDGPSGASAVCHGSWGVDMRRY